VRERESARARESERKSERKRGINTDLSFRAAFYFERERDKNRAKTLGNI